METGVTLQYSNPSHLTSTIYGATLLGVGDVQPVHRALQRQTGTERTGICYKDQQRLAATRSYCIIQECINDGGRAKG